jgi:isomerase DpgB
MSKNSINTNQASGERNSPLLQLNIAGGIPLSELTVQVNSLCEQAEEHAQAIVVLEFIPTIACIKWPGEVDIQAVNRWERVVRRLERVPAVMIGVASGVTSGPALDLLLVTDYRITMADFRLYIPINDKQVWPGMAIHRLVNQIGVARTRQLLMGSHEITAQQALNIGLIDEIAETTLTAAISVAILRFGSMSCKEFSIRRQLLLEASTTSFEDALGTNLAACDRELRRLGARKEDNQRKKNDF